MKKNIILTALALTMFVNPFSAFAETGDETQPESSDTTQTTTQTTTGTTTQTTTSTTTETTTTTTTTAPPKKYNLTFLDFDGEVMQKIEVTSEEKIDYSQIDTSCLHSFVDMYTEQAFSKWSSSPEYISEDTTVQALWKKGCISTDGTPSKTEYYSKRADVDFTGLSVIITLETQTPETDEDGNFIIEKQENNIISSCYAEKTLEELFSDGKTATVNVIPVGEDKPIFSYEVTLFDSLGDTNGDNIVDSVDSSFILATYAELSTGAENTLDETQQKICDINQDGIVDAIDATYVLMYYAESSTNGNAVWENIIEY